MSASTKHHILWGSIIAALILCVVSTLNNIYLTYAGLPTGPGLVLGLGQGTIVIAVLEIGGMGVEIEEYEDGKFIYWFELKDECILFIPIWIVALLPAALWIRSIYRLRTLST